MKELDEIMDRFDVLIALLHEIRNKRGDVAGRGVSIAITHVETGRLWFDDAIKDVEEKAS